MGNIINEKLQARLLENGHDIDQLADEIGITKGELADKLNGSTSWLWNEAVAVARMTNSSLNELAGMAACNASGKLDSKPA